MTQPDQRAPDGNDVLRIRYLGGPTAVIEIGGRQITGVPAQRGPDGT